ncbi:choline dehydrogenase [Sclerotinia borealis F-4128]|uniref:Choline dehydrogenase n=1 Tax=Sclerotinia borealis (strain F-4128) TaxID=1432307 RepID=W9CGI3_SCLBF|nr:choline dehydrogenase [Sclerotinia borealis F-4128]
MKGVIITAPNAPWQAVDDIERPVPGKGQILVKSLVTGINPLYALFPDPILFYPIFQTPPIPYSPYRPLQTNSEITNQKMDNPETTLCAPRASSSRNTPSSSAATPQESSLRPAMELRNFAWERACLGVQGWGHLMDEKLAFKRPERVSVEEAATIGVGLLTAAICLDEGNNIMYPAERQNQPEWFIVLGGTSTVGQYGIKLAKLCGYQVLASCSQSSIEVVRSAGADATFDYKQSIETQLSEIESITSGDFAGIFDASAASTAVGIAALKTKSAVKTQKKTFSTTNDWDTIEEQEDTSTYHVHLEQIGKYGEPAGDATNRAVEKLIPRLESLLWKGWLEPNYGEIVATGFGGVGFGVDLLTKSAPLGGKIVVRDTALLTNYDFIIVGGGTSGLVVGNRLSENPATTVLIIEAGELDQGEDFIYIPLLAGIGKGATGTKYDWNLTYSPQPAANDRSIAIAQGKVVGGGSCLNLMAFDLAGKVDYDRWVEVGGVGWNDLFPYFKKLTNYTPPAPEIAKEWDIQTDPTAHGYKGYVHSSYPTFYWPSNKYFFTAMKFLGIRKVFDSLNGDVNGALWNPHSLDPDTKTRSNSRTAYWNSASNRTNLHLLTGHHVTRLITKSNSGGVSVAGVEASYSTSSNGSRSIALAAKEVVLAAGVIHSPQLLQLSGIGNPSLLGQFGINTVVNLPGVGANFQDHPLLRYTTTLDIALSVNNLTRNATFNAEMLALYKFNRTGPYSTAGANAYAFIGTPSFTNATLQIVSLASSITPASYLPSNVDPSVLVGYEAQYKILTRDLASNSVPIMEFIYLDGSVLAILQHPFSRGSVAITSTDPFTPPSANPGFLSHQTDLLLLSAAGKYARTIINTPTFAPLSPVETIPGPSVQTEADFEAWVRSTVFTTHHPTGSTSMMKRQYGGVVDSNYKVYGVNNLRVVDAGTFPMLPAAHLQATVYAMAERASDVIKKTYRH